MEVNAVETIARLTLLQTHKDHPNDTHTQSTYSNSTLTNNDIHNSPQNNTVYPHNQSTVILQQFGIIQELRNFMDKVSHDITKITQACTTAQENTGKLIENVISQAFTKPQDITPPNPTVDSRSNQTSNSSCETNWTSSWPTTNYGMSQQSNNDTYHLWRPFETPTSPHAHVNQQPPTKPHLTSINP